MFRKTYVLCNTNENVRLTRPALNYVPCVIYKINPGAGAIEHYENWQIG
jgi:hypothetical protein